jgi:hypothetical protein
VCQARRYSVLRWRNMTASAGTPALAWLHPHGVPSFAVNVWGRSALTQGELGTPYGCLEVGCAKLAGVAFSGGAM